MSKNAYSCNKTTHDIEEIDLIDEFLYIAMQTDTSKGPKGLFDKSRLSKRMAENIILLHRYLLN